MKTLLFLLLISFSVNAQVATTDTTYHYLEDSLVWITVRYDSIHTSFRSNKLDSACYKLVEQDNVMFWVSDSGEFTYKKETYPDSTISYEMISGSWHRHFSSITKRYTLWHNDGRCEAITKAGTRCKRSAKIHFCWQHD